MAVLVGNETYKRFVFDPEDGEVLWIVDGENLTSEEFAARVAEDSDTRPQGAFVKPNPDARKIWVTFRPLRAGDKYAIQDLTAENGEVAAGTGRRMLIKRAVVKWDYDVAWSEAVLDQLDDAIEVQIYGWISWGSEPPEQDPETGQRVLPPTEPGTSPEATETEKPAAGSSSRKTKTSKASPPESDGDASS
jgi:hypothetical protein